MSLATASRLSIAAMALTAILAGWPGVSGLLA